MKLGIISDAHHYYDQEARLYTLTLLARQFERWADIFDEIIICAPLIDGSPLPVHSFYRCQNIRLLPISAAGGDTVLAKLDLLKKSVTWVSALVKLIQQVDAVHIRCPNNISILGLFLLQFSPVLRQAVYTGSWIGHPIEPLTYRFQRWFLRSHFRGPVAVYGNWDGQPEHVVASFSPSYSKSDWDGESEQVCKRLERLERLSSIPHPVRLMSVGLLNKNKNQVLILHALRYIIEQGTDCVLDLLGDGNQRHVLEKQANHLGLKDKVFFHGNVSHSTVREFYRRADFVIQSPYSEGFGKVPMEAFFHGVVPILSDVDMSSQIVGMGIRGRCFPQDDAHAIALHVLELVQKPAIMIQMIKNGRDYALGITLESWQNHLCEMLNRYWGTKLKTPYICSEKSR